MKSILIFLLLALTTTTTSFTQGMPPNNIETSTINGGILKAITPVVIEGETRYIYEHSQPITSTTLTPGTGINIINDVVSNTGDLSTTNELEFWKPYIVSGNTVGVIRWHPTNVLLNDTFRVIGIPYTPPNGAETVVQQGSNIVITGSGTTASPYVVANPSPESTTVSDSPQIDFTQTGSNITGTIINSSITPTMLSQTYLTTESQTIVLDSVVVAGVSKTYTVSVSGTPGTTRKIVVPLTSGGGSVPVRVALSANASSSSTTVTNTSPNTFTYTFPSLGFYKIDFYGTFSTAATTTGCKIGYATNGLSPVNSNGIWKGLIVTTSAATSIETGPGISSILTTTGVGLANTLHALSGSHIVEVTTLAGNFISVRWGSEISGSAATLAAGSSMVITKL